MNTAQEPGAALPTRRNLALIIALTYIIALFLAGASAVGLVYRGAVYPTETLRQSFVSNDAVSLVVGLPVLIGSMYLARRGRLVGLLLWPGAVFYVLYNCIVYVLAIPLNGAFLLHLALVTLSVYTLSALVANIDGEAVRQRLLDAVPERFAGGVLAGLGFLFFVRVVVAILGTLRNETSMAETDLALNVSDFLIAPAMLIGGILLWRRNQFGYVTGLGLLFQASMLFIGLAIFLLLRPFLTTAPFVLTDVVVILLLGLICFVPFSLFVRGVVSSRSKAPV